LFQSESLDNDGRFALRLDERGQRFTGRRDDGRPPVFRELDGESLAGIGEEAEASPGLRCCRESTAKDDDGRQCPFHWRAFKIFRRASALIRSGASAGSSRAACSYHLTASATRSSASYWRARRRASVASARIRSRARDCSWSTTAAIDGSSCRAKSNCCIAVVKSPAASALVAAANACLACSSRLACGGSGGGGGAFRIGTLVVTGARGGGCRA